MVVEDTPYKHQVMRLVHSHESYSIGTKKEVPDIVIEVIVTSGTINRKELYRPKKIPEVWFWKFNQIQIFRLNTIGEYKEVDRSGFFPDLDKAILLKYIAYPDQYDAVQEFIQTIRDISTTSP
jgi:Uma2 family endonuclease